MVFSFLAVIASVVGIVISVQEESVGSKGPVGNTGLRGPLGPTGSQGSQGEFSTTGATGPTGTNGGKIVGPSGSTGIIGAPGEIGLGGLTGSTGPVGRGGTLPPFANYIFCYRNVNSIELREGISTIGWPNYTNNTPDISLEQSKFETFTLTKNKTYLISVNICYVTIEDGVQYTQLAIQTGNNSLVLNQNPRVGAYGKDTNFFGTHIMLSLIYTPTTDAGSSIKVIILVVPGSRPITLSTGTTISIITISQPLPGGITSVPNEDRYAQSLARWKLFN